MSAPVLTEDCILEVINQLQDDRSTLYKFLFVNRLFCRIAIPILYKRPFHNIQDHLHYYLLINTFLACFDEEERISLNKVISIKDDESPFKILLFEYEKYVQDFPYSKLEFATHIWYYYYDDKMNKCRKFISEKSYFINNAFFYDDKFEVVKNLLFHLFLRKSVNLKYLEVRNNILNSNFFNLKFFNEIIYNLRDLKKLNILINENGLNFKISKLNDFLDIISKNCFNLSELEIFITCDYELSLLPLSISILIQNQKNLKIFNFLKDNIHIKLSNVLKSLKSSQQNSLTELRLDYCRDLDNQNFVDSIIEFNCLETLTFSNCYGLNLDVCTKLSKANLKLNHLELRESHWDAEITAALISSVGNTLKNLVLQEMQFRIHDLEEIYESISLYCTNLENFKTWIDHIPNLKIFDYLKFIKCKHLFIYFEFSDYFHEYLGLGGAKSVIGQFSENLPDTLKVCTINIKPEVSVNYLENFFSNYNSNNIFLEILNLDFLMTDEILNFIILKFIDKMKSLKLLRIVENYRNEFFDKEKNHLNKKLLEEIRNYGIKVEVISEEVE